MCHSLSVSQAPAHKVLRELKTKTRKHTLAVRYALATPVCTFVFHDQLASQYERARFFGSCSSPAAGLWRRVGRASHVSFLHFKVLIVHMVFRTYHLS